MLRNRVLFVGLAMLALALPAPAGATAADDAAHAEQATTLEQQGRLDAAYAELAQMAKPTKAQATHRAHVADAIQAIAAADALTTAKDPGAAQATLDAARAKLDVDADRFVVVVLAQKSTTARAAAHEDADAQATETIGKGDALGRRRRWSEAAETYKSVATKPAGAVSAALVQKATVKQLRAEQRALADQDGPTAEFFTSVWHTIRDALRWLLLAAIVLAVWVALVRVRRARQGRRVPGKISLLLVDGTADSKDQDAKDLALRNEFADAVQEVRFSSLAADNADLDERRDLDGTAAPAMLRPANSGGLDAVVKDIQLSIGPVKVSPLQLFAFWRWLWERPGEHEIRGTLRTHGKGTELSVDLGKQHWSAADDADGSRAVVVRLVAQKFVVESRYSYITTSWRSFAAYTDGLAALARAGKTPPKEREKVLDEARVALERAVAQDAANLVARLRLASVLRAMGHNADAAGQFSRLMEDVLHPRRVPLAARDFAKRHPELFWYAAVNRAVSLGKLSDGRPDGVLDELAILVAALGPPLTKPPVLMTKELPELKRRLREANLPKALPWRVERQRLHVVVLAAWAAQLALSADQSDKGRTPRGRERLKARQNRVVVRLEAVKAELAALSGPDVEAAVGQATAVVENALARVEVRRGHRPVAREAALRALALDPNLGDAHVTIAELAIAGGRDGWAADAERHLRSALAVSPNDHRALYGLGRVYRRIGDRAGAKEVLENPVLRTDWRALQLLGEVALDGDEYAVAIPWLVRSQARNPAMDYRADLLLNAVLKLSAVKDATLLTADGRAVLAAADRVVKAAGDDPVKRAAAMDKRRAIDGAVKALTGQAPQRHEEPLPGPD